jgi:hypothetical protein
MKGIKQYFQFEGEVLSVADVRKRLPFQLSARNTRKALRAGACTVSAVKAHIPKPTRRRYL